MQERNIINIKSMKNNIVGFVVYILYLLELLLKLPFYWKDTYRNISFEREAYTSQYDCNYLKNMITLSG
jgi:hypothetical protein